MKILFPDNWHFHQRNYAPIFQALKQNSIPYVFETSRGGWWRAHGNYHNLRNSLRNSLEYVDQFTDLEKIDHLGINLWQISKAEFLCNALAQDRWHEGGLPNESRAVMEYALIDEVDTKNLTLCLAAAHDWLDFWSDYFDQNSEITHAIIFSGSYVYTKALMAIAKARNIAIILTEHFFTGNDFYFERRDKPIANNCGLPYFKNEVVDDTNGLDRLMIGQYVHARIEKMRNRNTPHGDNNFINPWSDKNPILLIVGQVVNDFSLIETPSNELSSIATYKKTIFQILNSSDCNIVFKAHPWERRRAPMFAPYTKIQINQFIQSLPLKHQTRIQVIENEPIRSIFPYCDGVVGISSQGLLEACHFGFKPNLLGKAFFSENGFTHDGPKDLNCFFDLNEMSQWKLSLDEYQSYQRFMRIIFSTRLLPNQVSSSSLVIETLYAPHSPPRIQFLLKNRKKRSLDLKEYIREIYERSGIVIRDGLIWIKHR